jgi:hypothetical protein
LPVGFQESRVENRGLRESVFKRHLLPPFQPASVPAFPGWAAVLGPGVVWMALAQGSGELIWWPYLIAKYGLAFLFLLIPACLLQGPLTFEVGRYTLLTGESIWQGFVRLHPWFAFPLWLLMAVSFLWFGAFASAGGTSLAALTDFPAGWSPRAQSLFWGYVAIAVFLSALVVSPVTYGFIERFMWVVAILTVGGLAAACAHPTVTEKVPAFLSGLARPGRLPRPWDPADAKPFLTALTFAGLGGFWTLFYSYWLREKGFGLARLSGPLAGLFGHGGAVAPTGFLPKDEPGGAARLSRWTRALGADAGIGIAGNIATTLMTCLLAYALLTPRGLLPEGWNIAVVQSEFFAVRWGEWGRCLFLAVAAAFMADTWLSTVDAVSRVNADVVRAFFERARRKSPRWWYFFFLAALTAVTCATMPLAQPGPLILISAVTGFVGTVAFSIALLFLNHRLLPEKLPAFARPGHVSAALLGASCGAYILLAGVYLWLEFAQ